MNNKLTYRLIGALSSAMIIVSVFIPFLKFSGYTQSIWDAYGKDFIFLPILIISFGLIGVLTFSINKKIEFSYATSGAMIFYSVMRTFEIINQGMFKNLNIGYYFLVIGSILTGIMAYLCNIRLEENSDNIDMIQTKMNMDNMMQQNNDIQSINSDSMNLNSNLTPLMDIPNTTAMSNENFNVQDNFQNLPLESIKSDITTNVPVQSLVEPVNSISQTNQIPETQIQGYNQQVLNNIPIVEPALNEVSNQLNFGQQFQPIVEINPPLVEPVNSVSQVNQIPEIQIQNYNQQGINNTSFNPFMNQVQADNSQILNNIPIVEPTLNEVPNQLNFGQQFDNQNSTEQINNNISNIQNYSMPNSQSFNSVSTETDIFGQPINRN